MAQFLKRMIPAVETLSGTDLEFTIGMPKRISKGFAFFIKYRNDNDGRTLIHGKS